ncbi:concanavalin A-like lectin/glucanase domain-containing protein, partial [Cercophora newfieldiana]
NNQMQTNYFSKGCTATYDRGAYHAIKNSTAEFHTYSVNWTPERLDWLVDGVVTRTLLAETVKTSSCGGFPQAPMKVDVGSWVAGKKDASPGTIEWAGGLADFSNGPLKTYIKSINVTDDAKGVKNAVQYRYTDMSGRAESIVVE